MRRRSVAEAQRDIRTILGCSGTDLASRISIVLGDARDADLPTVSEVFNVGGYTNLAGSFDDHWRGNVLTTAHLCRHAANVGARLNHISTISVAVGRMTALTENDAPIPTTTQTSYSYSKSLAELAARRLTPRDLCVYRVPDVIPPQGEIDGEIRKDHWLTLICGTGAVVSLPPSYTFHAVPADDLARAILTASAMNESKCLHLFGPSYSLGMLAKMAMDDRPLPPHHRMGMAIGRLVTNGTPLPELVTQAETTRAFRAIGVEFEHVDERYWQRFVAAAAAQFVVRH